MATDTNDRLDADCQPTESSVHLVLCPICCEDKLCSGIALSSCSHSCCRSCLFKWIEKEEASGQMSPACPFCRITSSGTDVLAILGRMFQRREAISGDPNEEEEIDELTQSWLNEHTKVCQGCGSRVEKPYGCSHMECLCGYRFCYSCGSPGGFCSCGLSRGFVFSPQRRSVDVDGMIRNASGQVDLRSTLLQRKVRSESEQQRRKAYAEVIPNQIEKYDYLDIIVWYDWAGVIKKVTYLINQWSR